MKILKKVRKAFAGLLSAAVVMAGLVVPVGADDTINPDTEVSLTIHKYEDDGSQKGTATGMESDGDSLTGRTGLNGVTFTVYKIADITQTSGTASIKYNVTNQDILNVVGNTITSDSVASDLYDDIKTVLDSNGFTDKCSKTTTTVNTIDGIAAFANNELFGQGLYLVVETDVPDKVSQTIDPFFVSLPMTVEVSDDSQWLYDVHAYPKNAVQTSGINIGKYGIAPGGDVSAAGDLNGATFYLQKMGATTWETVINDDSGNAIGDNTGLFTLNTKSGYKNIEALSKGRYRIVENSAPTDYGYIGNSGACVYFVVDETTGEIFYTDAAGVKSGNALTSIHIYNEKPEVTKQVLKKNSDSTVVGNWVDVADYSVGDTMEFKIGVDIPSSIKDLEKFTLTDTFNVGTMDVDDTSFKYTYYQVVNGNKTDISTLGLTIDKPSVIVNSTNDVETGWVLDFDTDYKEDLAENEVKYMEIVYSAVLTNKATTTDNGNMNKITLNYSTMVYANIPGNNPVPPVNPIPIASDYDSAFVYTFALQLNKTFEGGSTSNLSAKFDLYEECGPKEGVMIGSIGENEVYGIKLNNDSYITDENGKISICTDEYNTGDQYDFAVSNGTYYFVETDTADGYNLLKEPVKVVVSFDMSGVAEVGGYSINKSVNVVNKKGFSLPSTGGRGTLIFTISGLSLMLAALLIFFRSKKKQA